MTISAPTARCSWLTLSTPKGSSALRSGRRIPSGLRIAKTASRSVLSHMNETAFDAQYPIESGGGLALTDVDDVNRQLHRHLRGRGGDYVIPLGTGQPALGPITPEILVHCVCDIDTGFGVRHEP